MKTWEFFAVLASIAVAPHLPVYAALAVAAIYVVAAAYSWRDR